MTARLLSDPFCGGCGAACGQPCDPGCGAHMIGDGQGAVLLLAIYVPNADRDTDPEIVASEFAAIINEERYSNGGVDQPVTVSTWPRPQWLRWAGVIA